MGQDGSSGGGADSVVSTTLFSLVGERGGDAALAKELEETERERGGGGLEREVRDARACFGDCFGSRSFPGRGSRPSNPQKASPSFRVIERELDRSDSAPPSTVDSDIFLFQLK